MSEYCKIKTTFYHLDAEAPGSTHTPPALMHEPVEPGERSQICVLLMHHSADYLTFTPAIELAKRGYRVLGANTVSPRLDQKVREVKLAVDFLRLHPGIKKIVLLGHSGGSTLMSAYQAIAENGVQVFQGSEKLIKFPDVGVFSAADGVMMLDANFGNSLMTLLSLDPAITDETTGKKLDPALDLFNPANGFDPNGSAYKDDFMKRFQKAQGDRMNRLIDAALERLSLIESGKGRYEDDEPFIVPAATLMIYNNRLFPQDVRLLSHSRSEHMLLHADGSATTQIVPSVRRPVNNESMSQLYAASAMATTVRTFLASFAVRIKGAFSYNNVPSFAGVGWDCCYNSAIANVRNVSVPLLSMGMTAGYEALAAEPIYENAKTTDKSIAFVEGATHNFYTAKDCEAYDGQFGDTIKTTFDYVAQWLGEKGRFVG